MGADGRITRTQYGEYNLKDAFEYFLHRQMEGIVSNNQIGKVDDDVVKASKRRLEKAKADLAELEVQVEKLEKLDISSVKAFLGSEVATFKRELLGLPRGLPSDCYGLDEDEIRVKLREILTHALSESSDRFNYKSLIEYLED